MNIDVIPLRTNILCQATFCPSGLASISWSFDHINTNIAGPGIEFGTPATLVSTNELPRSISTIQLLQ